MMTSFSSFEENEVHVVFLRVRVIPRRLLRD